MSRRKKVFLMIAITIALLVVAIVIIVHLLSGSSEGTVHVGAPSSNVSATQPTTLTTPLFSTTLPVGFTVKRQSYDPAADPQLQLEANTPSATDEQVAISAGPLPAGGIKGLGDYNLRATRTDIYGPFTPAALPSSALAFRTLSSPTEFTVFWPHDTRYYEISLSTGGVASVNQLDDVFTQLMAKWHWQ